MIPRHPEPKRTASLPPVSGNVAAARTNDLLEQEQALFEQRICEETMGIAIRKINQYGKSNLRYVRCVTVVDANTPGNRAVGSWVVRRSSTSDIIAPTETVPRYMALSWGKKKDVQIALRLFTAVRKGKTTDRARRNQAPANRILSLITVDPNHSSLDIEAPTVLDRDKFARAFARFLNVSLQEEDSVDTIHSADPDIIKVQDVKSEETSSLPGDSKYNGMPTAASGHHPPPTEGSFYPPRLQPSSPLARTTSYPTRDSSQHSSTHRESDTGKSNNSGSVRELTLNEAAVVSLVPAGNDKDDEENSHVSSLTGHGYDHELVEELHNALNELRTELEESRAEAARAVKVAEQAIQSAEKNNSVEWQNTVTHKAAEAAAMAQKRSASAMAKQRLAEERLEGSAAPLLFGENRTK
jgi:DNA-binding XRE family transcriptional regulator